YSGPPKWQDAPGPVEMFHQFGYSDGFRVFIGVGETVGGVAAVVSDFPFLGPGGACWVLVGGGCFTLALRRGGRLAGALSRCLHARLRRMGAPTASRAPVVPSQRRTPGGQGLMEASLDRPAPSRALNIAGWVASVLLCALFLFAGVPKWMGAQQAVDGFRSFGFSDGFRIFIGVCETLGGIGLLIPRLSFWAACGLVLIMIGAIHTQVTHPE